VLVVNGACLASPFIVSYGLRIAGRRLLDERACGVGAKEDDGWWRYRQAVGTKAERRAAGAHVSAYHEARLGELIEYLTAAVDRYRAGEIDTHDVDEAIHHYHRAARERWKFCWTGGGGTHTEIIAHFLDRMATDGESINWWDRVAPLQRD
jgi:hypothetical protein